MTADRVDAIHEQYLASTRHIRSFLWDAEVGFRRIETQNSGLVEKFRAAKEGREIPVKPGEDLISVELSLEEVEALEEAVVDALSIMEHYPGMLAEMALMYLISVFEAFLSDLMRCFFQLRPEALRLSKQLSVEDVIAAPSRDQLIADLASREVGSWTYESFSEQMKRISNQVGTDFDEFEVDLGVITEGYARRNLLAHHGGVVDAKYKAVVTGASTSIGQRLESDSPYWDAVATEFDRLAGALVSDVLMRLPRSAGD
jgi:hypothetical protein